MPPPHDSTLYWLMSAVRYTLTAELLLGGQARLTQRLTPKLHERVMSKAEGTRKHLSFLPIRDPAQHSRFIGFLMCGAAMLLCWQWTRLAGAVLSICLSLLGVYAQYAMRIPYWLPSVNTALGAIVIYAENAAGKAAV